MFRKNSLYSNHNTITMRTKIFLVTLTLLYINNISFSQSNDCLNDFDYLVKKIQADYPGYNDKVNDANRPQLKLLESDIRNKMSLYPDSCRHYFNQYTDFFKDYHLRVGRTSGDQKQQLEIMEVSTYGKNLHINIDSLQKATIDASGIEGVWEGFSKKFVVTKDGQKFVAVAVTFSGWNSGQVIYEFEPVNDTLFDVIKHSLVKDKKTRKGKASLHLTGKVLEMHDETRFVRKSNSDLMDKVLLYSYVPLFPNGVNIFPMAMTLDDSTYFLRVPSFYDETANEFVLKNWNEITSRPNLIIDIRYNGGGQDNFYAELAKLIYTKPYESKGVEWYATEGNIKLFEDAIKNGEYKNGEEGLKWIQSLLEAMKKNVGGFVTHPYSQNDSDIREKDTVYAMPRKVGIIINEGNASSAEQFLLFCKQSDKVTLFGNCNTAGVLDYSNITPNPLPSGNYELWCPMTRSKRLPESPIDNIGIAPDVIIPFPATEQLFDKLDIWVYFVKNYLELLDK